MKKVMIMAVTIGLVLCAACFTAWKIYDNHQMSKRSDLMMQNLNALSQDGENGGNWRDGRSMESLLVYKGMSVSSPEIIIGRRDMSVSMPGYTWTIERIFCCELTHPRNSCNGNGENPDCANLLP